MLSWDSPQSAERVHMYCVNISIGLNQMTSRIDTNTPVITLDQLPYNQEITVEIASLNCYSESAGVTFNFLVSK